MATIRTTLQDEIRDVIDRHLDELDEFIPSTREPGSARCEQVVSWIEQLADICQSNAETASIELYGKACSCRHSIEMFLKSMNQCMDSNFRRTSIGQIWVQSQIWCQRVGTQYRLSLHDVWDVIAPVAPDYLNDLGGGQYEARWWKPVPTMDIEILKYTDGVVIDGDAFEPPNLSGGLALRFSVSRFG
jgi:hypothetical protein